MAKRLGQVTGSRVKLSRVGLTRIFLIIFFFNKENVYLLFEKSCNKLLRYKMHYFK